MAGPPARPAEISPLRKAAIVLVSLEQSLASQLLSHLDRSAVEMVTWEIARLDRVDPEERAAVLEEFYGLGLRRLCFVFDDLVKMGDADIRAAFHDEDIETWALALAGAAATVRAKVLGALPLSASAAALRRQLETPRPVPALRFGGRPARDRRPAPAALRPRLDQPPGAQRQRRGPRLIGPANGSRVDRTRIPECDEPHGPRDRPGGGSGLLVGILAALPGARRREDGEPAGSPSVRGAGSDAPDAAARHRLARGYLDSAD